MYNSLASLLYVVNIFYYKYNTYFQERIKEFNLILVHDIVLINNIMWLIVELDSGYYILIWKFSIYPEYIL